MKKILLLLTVLLTAALLLNSCEEQLLQPTVTIMVAEGEGYTVVGENPRKVKAGEPLTIQLELESGWMLIHENGTLAKKAEITIPASLETNLLKLRTADTAAYTATLKEIKENPRNFNKLLELAKKHNIELFPARRMPMRDGRNVEAPNRSRDNMRPNFNKLRKDYPEEMKKYNELRSSDPAKARAFLQDLIKRSQEANNKK